MNENNEKIEQLVNQIQNDGGKVVQDKDQHFTYDQASDAVNDQNDIISDLQKYQQELDQYNNMLHQHGEGSSIQGIDTDKIKQNLVINADFNVTVDVKVLQPDLVHIEHDENIINTNPTPNHDSKDYWIVKTNKPYGTETVTPVADSNNIINQEMGAVVIPGAFAQAVYTSNDGMWMYKNQKITKN